LDKPLGKLPKLRQNSPASSEAPAVFPPKSKPPFGGLLRPAKNPARFSTSNPIHFRGVHSVQALTLRAIDRRRHVAARAAALLIGLIALLA
jgi:hypothetical protein